MTAEHQSNPFRWSKHRVASVTALVASLVSLLTHYAHLGPQQLSSTYHMTTGDSKAYLRDALALRHRLFGLPGDQDEYIIRVFRENSIPQDWLSSPGNTRFHHGDKLLPSLVRAVLLHAVDNNLTIVFYVHLVLLALAAYFVTYVVVREAGLLGGGVAIVCLVMTSMESTIPTFLLEPTLAFFWPGLAFASWLVLKRIGGWWGIATLALFCAFGMLLKSNVQPLYVLGSMVCGWSAADRLCEGIRKMLTGVLGSILCVSFILGVTGGASKLIQAHLGLRDVAMRRTNAPYALWMGSLPSRWTGTYSGRISASTFWFIFNSGADPQYQQQGLTVRNRGIYYVPLREILPSVIYNYRHFPVDAMKRFVFRYSKMLRIHGFQEILPAFAAACAIAGCLWIALLWRSSLFPWVLSLQYVLWIHAISRYRPRDREQITVLVAMLASLGIARLVSILLRKPSPTRSGDSQVAPRAGVRWVLAGLILLPVGLAAAFPETQSLSKPGIGNVACWVADEDGTALHVEAKLSAPYLYGSLEFIGDQFPMAREHWVGQADASGHLEFVAPIDEPQRFHYASIVLSAWSLTEQVERERVVFWDAPYAGAWSNAKEAEALNLDFTRKGAGPLPDGWNLVWPGAEREPYDVIKNDSPPGNPMLRLTGREGTPQYFFTGSNGFTHPPGSQHDAATPRLQSNRWYRLDLTAQTAKQAGLTLYVFLYDRRGARWTIRLGRVADISKPTPLTFLFRSPERPARYRLGMRLSGDGTACVSGLKLSVYERTGGERSVTQ